MNNTLRAALSVADEGVVKGIGKELIRAFEKNQGAQNNNKVNVTTNVGRSASGLADMRFKRFADSTAPFPIFGVKTPKTNI